MTSTPHEGSSAGDQQRWARVKAAFLAAVDRPEPERPAFVAALCGADAELRDEVLSLLESHAAAGNFAERPGAALLVEGSHEAEATAPRLLPGTRLGPYEVVGFLSAGGMGQVYRARHTILERQVAIKTVCPGASDPAARRRLVREARHASVLEHPNICTIHEVGEAEGMPFIVMGLVEGRPLNEMVRDDSLSMGTVLEYGIAVADALEHAHQHGIVHRDLKSSNVMVDREGRHVVLDFGLARRLPVEGLERGESMVTGAGVLAGTLSHMAPEVLMGGQADTRSDVWSLGVLLFELTTRELPFSGRTPFETSSAIMDDAPCWPAGAVPLAVRLVIERCLVKDPDARYQRAADVRAALETIQRRSTLPLVGRLLVAARRRSLYAAGAALVALGVVGTAGLVVLDRIQPTGPRRSCHVVRYV